MMKIKIEDLTDEQLDGWVARAQGWALVAAEGRFFADGWVNSDDRLVVYVRDYTPTTNPAQWAELIENFGNIAKQELQIIEDDEAYGVYLSRTGNSSYSDYIWGESVCIAICRAVIASVYGKDVEVKDE